jgi:hypothetical protein
MIFLLFTKKTSKALYLKLDKHIARVGMHQSHITEQMKEKNVNKKREKSTYMVSIICVFSLITYLNGIYVYVCILSFFFSS